MSEKRLFSEKVGIQKKKSDLGLFSENVWISEKNLRIQKQKNTKFYFYLKYLSFYFGGIYTPFFKML